MSQYTLVIVESPAKCKKIEEYLGDGYKCIASFGHFKELDGLKSINITKKVKKSSIRVRKSPKQMFRASIFLFIND